MLNQNAIHNPRRLLLTVFTTWKLFLLATALGSALVSEAYDTSGSLALSLRSSREPRDGVGLTVRLTWLHLLAARLTSWDAIYFVTAARRGYEFEQEWAFGSGLQLLIRGLVKGRDPCRIACPNHPGSMEWSRQYQYGLTSAYPGSNIRQTPLTADAGDRIEKRAKD